MYVDAQFDLVYGFRGSGEAVDVLTPYEMLLFYHVERILPPTCEEPVARAMWTTAGTMYRKTCKEQQAQPRYEAGVHYVATPAEHRTLLPDLPAPIAKWFFAELPRPEFSPEEHARLCRCTSGEHGEHGEKPTAIRPWQMPDHRRQSCPCLDAA